MANTAASLLAWLSRGAPNTMRYGYLAKVFEVLLLLALVLQPLLSKRLRSARSTAGAR
jgi:hypothetical protein